MGEVEAVQVVSPRTPGSAGVPDEAAPSPEAVQRRLSLAGSTPWQGKSSERESVCDTGGHIRPHLSLFSRGLLQYLLLICGTLCRFHVSASEYVCFADCDENGMYVATAAFRPPRPERFSGSLPAECSFVPETPQSECWSDARAPTPPISPVSFLRAPTLLGSLSTRALAGSPACSGLSSPTELASSAEAPDVTAAGCTTVAALVFPPADGNSTSPAAPGDGAAAAPEALPATSAPAAPPSTPAFLSSRAAVEEASADALCGPTGAAPAGEAAAETLPGTTPLIFVPAAAMLDSSSLASGSTELQHSPVQDGGGAAAGNVRTVVGFLAAPPNTPATPINNRSTALAGAAAVLPGSASSALNGAAAVLAAASPSKLMPSAAMLDSPTSQPSRPTSPPQSPGLSAMASCDDSPLPASPISAFNRDGTSLYGSPARGHTAPDAASNAATDSPIATGAPCTWQSPGSPVAPPLQAASEAPPGHAADLLPAAGAASAIPAAQAASIFVPQILPIAREAAVAPAFAPYSEPPTDGPGSLSGSHLSLMFSPGRGATAAPDSPCLSVVDVSGLYPGPNSEGDALSPCSGPRSGSQLSLADLAASPHWSEAASAPPPVAASHSGGTASAVSPSQLSFTFSPPAPGTQKSAAGSMSGTDGEEEREGQDRRPPASVALAAVTPGLSTPSLSGLCLL